MSNTIYTVCLKDEFTGKAFVTEAHENGFIYISGAHSSDTPPLQIIDTRDENIRQSLIALGWTPPEGRK